MGRAIVVLLIAVGCGAPDPPARRARPGHYCADGEWGIPHPPHEMTGTYHPPTYTCIRCASPDDVVVAVDHPAHEPPFGIPEDPGRWRCKRRCRTDRGCLVGRCISGWLDPHCDEPGRDVIIDGEAP